MLEFISGIILINVLSQCGMSFIHTGLVCKETLCYFYESITQVFTIQ
jgi:hypothetical protein